MCVSCVLDEVDGCGQCASAKVSIRAGSGRTCSNKQACARGITQEFGRVREFVTETLRRMIWH